MMKTIGMFLKVVWTSFAATCDLLNKIIMLPWNLAFKLYHWVYD